MIDVQMDAWMDGWLNEPQNSGADKLSFCVQQLFPYLKISIL